MGDFTPLDMQTWHRADLFHHYTEVWPGCLMSYKVTLDVTKTVKYIKKKGGKIAPALYFLTNKALNEQDNFKMGYLEENFGIWDGLCPFYPIMNQYEDISFHFAKWSESYQEYLKNYTEEAKINVERKTTLPDDLPANGVLVSILPFMNFDSISFSLKNSRYYLAPCVFMGRFMETGKGLSIPVSITINHASADGYHVQKFFDSMQEKLNNPQKWLEG